MNNPWCLKPQPRQWQAAALARWQRDMRGIVSVVTGGGKTVFAELCMLQYRKVVPHGIFIIVVPTKALVDQWHVSLVEDLGVPPDQIATFSGDGIPRTVAPINLMVINSARKWARVVADTAPTFLIVDECHHAGSPVNARVLQPAYRATLGLSATPVREHDEGSDIYLEPGLGPVIYQYDYTDAHRDHVISPFRLVHVRTTFLAHEQKRYDLLTRRLAQAYAEDAEEEKIRRLQQLRAGVSANAAMRIPVAAKLAETEHGERTLIFHERVEAADKIAKVLRSRHLSVTVYHTHIGPALRRDNLVQFRRGIFDILVCCRALDEGINVPEASVGIIASSTASTRQRIQRLGRMLRPAIGKDYATIYTVYVTDLEEERLKNESHDLDGVAETVWLRSSRKG